MLLSLKQQPLKNRYHKHKASVRRCSTTKRRAASVGAASVGAASVGAAAGGAALLTSQPPSSCDIDFKLLLVLLLKKWLVMFR